MKSIKKKHKKLC